MFISVLSTSIALAQNVSIGHTAPVAKLDIRGTATSPSIPGFLSNGILRVGVSTQEGIDIGKMGVAPWSGWIQSGAGAFFLDPLSLQPLGGNVGIGTGIAAPTAKLHVNGTLKVVDGTQGVGKILTSDATGLASWQPPPPPPGTNDPSVSICCQRWMSRNLDVTTYRNGDPIPEVTDPVEWAALTTGAYCYYDNVIDNGAIYGKLYNWYAVNDPRGLAPEGWYIPTDFEWTTLSNCLDGEAVAGGPMKEMGILHWNTPNTGATNLSGFTGLPGGYRGSNGSSYYIGDYGLWWTSTESGADSAWHRHLQNSSVGIFRSSAYFKRFGFSVRCLRD